MIQKLTSSILELEPLREIPETFELVDVPLPACFDLSKPYSPLSSTQSLQVKRLNHCDFNSSYFILVKFYSTSFTFN